MPEDAEDADTAVRRKQAQPTRARGKAGQRAVEAVLETANLVVQRVDPENDVGRDAFVDIVDGTDVTGGVISLQIKSGPSYFRGGQWVIPGHPQDFTLWRESTVPFFGVAHDPATNAIRWVDLSYAARVSDPYLSPVVSGPYGMKAVPVPEANRLDVEIEPFLDAARTALRRWSGLPTAALLSKDPDAVAVGIGDTFALGRHDPDAFLLLGALFRRLPPDCRDLALRALAMATRHPDIFWSKSNWIPSTVTRAVEERCRWGGDDLEALLALVDENGIERGTVGQAVFHVLELDKAVDDRLFELATNRGRLDTVRFWAAVVLLYHAGDDAPALLSRLLRRAPDLARVDNFEEVNGVIREFGYVSLF